MKAVNVDDVLKILHKYGRYIFVTDEKKYSSMVDEIVNLKALEQEPKTGHWIRRNAFLVPWKCSECNYESERYDNYCPNCGTRMVEPQESEM